MKYAKAKIPIRYQDSISMQDGYVFEVMFSDCITTLEIGVYRAKHDQWRVTCMHTGYLICYASTRKTAVKTFMERYLSKYERYVFSNERHGLSHKNWFEQKSDELKELISDYERGIA